MASRRLNQFFIKKQSHIPSDPDFQMARAHALKLFHPNAIYSFIPKNACSTLRLSVALQNEVIASPEDFNWIHSNNNTFSASLNDLIVADYTFVVLRCPYRRLASAYLDKIVERELDAWDLYNTLNRALDVKDMTFLAFARSLKSEKVRKRNIHWRNQCDFLVYESYDNYFALEEFKEAIKELKKNAKLKVTDARELTQHGSDSYTLLNSKNSLAKKKPLKFLNLKSKGYYPNYKDMFNAEIIDIVKKEYSDDIKLYKSKFSSKNLLFQ